jgi:hypothetical protein
MIKAESVPSFRMVEVEEEGPRESLSIESEEVLKTSSLEPGYRVPIPILLLESEYRV